MRGIPHLHVYVRLYRELDKKLVLRKFWNFLPSISICYF